MLRWIGLTAFALPFLEIVGFVWIGGELGLAVTLLWVMGAMVAGLLLLRRTGLQAVGKLRAALAEGREPGHSMLDSACFAAAAMLLIIPGFFSDALALILMLPATRHWLLRYTARHFDSRHFDSRHFETRVRGRTGPAGGVIHGEFTVVSEAGDDSGGGGEEPGDIRPPRRIGPESKGGGDKGGGAGRPIIDVE